MLVVAGATCTVAVRFVTDVVAVDVLVSVTVSVFAGSVTVFVSVVMEGRMVVVSLVVVSAAAALPALAASPAPTASNTMSGTRRTVGRELTWSGPLGRAGDACQVGRRRHHDGARGSRE